MIQPIVGSRSFMLLEGDRHLRGRRNILPVFDARAARDHVPLIAGLVERSISSWPRSVALALHPRLRDLTLEIILRTSLLSSPSSSEQATQIRGRILDMLNVTASATFPEPLLRHGRGRTVWRRFLADRTAVDRLLHAIIHERTQAPAHNGDLLDRLLAARNPDGSPFSHRQVRDDLMSIILAGHETTASQLAWAFQLLAHNPRVQQRLIEELDAGTGEGYLTATVKEVLRHRPVFLFAIPRAVTRPIEIGAWSHRPPAHLLACIYLLQHDPAVYPDPHAFRPERFLAPSGLPPAAAWLPWGGGRKRCPGSHLASLEIETVLRVVLEHATVEPAGERMERPRWRSVIVTPHAGCRVILRPR